MSKRADDDAIKSLTKVVAILDCFSTNTRTLSLAEVGRLTGYPRSTAHRLLASMRQSGLLEQDRERERYRLGIKLFSYGNTVLANMELHREARPFARALSRMTGFTVRIAVFGGETAVVIHNEEPEPTDKAILNLLESAPLHCTSVGKAILAFQDAEVLDSVLAGGFERYTDTTITDVEVLRRELASIRGNGFAVDNGEHQPGLHCIGAPIRDHSGRVIGGVSASASVLRWPEGREGAVAEMVAHHASLISGALGYVSPTHEPA